MTRKHCVSTVCLLGLFASVLGCEDQQSCTKNRMDLARTWETVKEVASKRKFGGDEESQNALLKQQRLERWGVIEDKAALLESSFTTPQITWNSAAKARIELNQQFTKIPESDDRGLPRFATLLDQANHQQAEFERTCR